MKKTFLRILPGVFLFLCISGTASATLTNVTLGGDRVVYDDHTDRYWYPRLTDFITMSRAQQEHEIAQLNDAGSSDWMMATWEQTRRLKDSLAEMASYFLAWDFAHMALSDPLIPDGTPGGRDYSAPNLAWSVNARKCFTPTAQLQFSGMDTIVFNGRYAGAGWVNNQGTLERDAEGIGTDHWAHHNLATGWAPEGIYLTMMFNYDGHPVSNDETSFMGDIGAWAVTEKVAPVPEPATMLLLVPGILGLMGFRKRFRK